MVVATVREFVLKRETCNQVAIYLHTQCKALRCYDLAIIARLLRPHTHWDDMVDYDDQNT